MLYAPYLAWGATVRPLVRLAAAALPRKTPNSFRCPWRSTSNWSCVQSRRAHVYTYMLLLFKFDYLAYIHTCARFMDYALHVCDMHYLGLGTGLSWVSSELLSKSLWWSMEPWPVQGIKSLLLLLQSNYRLTARLQLQFTIHLFNQHFHTYDTDSRHQHGPCQYYAYIEINSPTGIHLGERHVLVASLHHRIPVQRVVLLATGALKHGRSDDRVHEVGGHGGRTLVGLLLRLEISYTETNVEKRHYRHGVIHRNGFNKGHTRYFELVKL